MGANPENEEVSSALIRWKDTMAHDPIERSPENVETIIVAASPAA
jgi:hypothetical protein